MIFVMFVCLFDYVFVICTSKYFYLIYVCFIHVFSLELVHGGSLGLVRMKNEAFQVKGSKLGIFTSRHPLTSRQPFMSRNPSLLYRVIHGLTSRHLSFSVKSCNFLSFSSFRILDIILSKNIQIE